MIIIGIQNDYLNILLLSPGTNNVKFTNYTFCAIQEMNNSEIVTKSRKLTPCRNNKMHKKTFSVSKYVEKTLSLFLTFVLVTLVFY